ncbi:MAG: SpoIIE family protein phosphatase [Acidimicrobiia bacterium]
MSDPVIASGNDRASLVGVFAAVGEMADRVAAHDWASTPLGAIDQWAQSLRTAVSILLNTRYPMFLFWGPDAICIYNDAYRPSLGHEMHPTALGARADSVWNDIWHIIGPQISMVMVHGENTWFEDQLVPFDRSGYLEEIYFTYSYSPVYAETGTVGGTLVVCSETTEQVLAERRLRMLQALAVSSDDDIEGIAASFESCLRGNPEDVPFARLFRIDAARVRATSVAGVGVDLDGVTDPADPALPIDAAEVATSPWAELIAEALAADGPLTINDVPDRFGDLGTSPWPEPPTEAVVLSIATETDGSEYLVVLGASPRKRIDSSYRDFFQLLGVQLGAALARAKHRELERLRLEQMAELDRARTNFFTNTSHELRTPLTLILGPLEELLATIDGPDRVPLEMAHRNAAQLLGMVNALLDFARAEAGQLDFDPTPSDLGALTAECVSMFEFMARQSGISLNVDCEPDAMASVDRALWQRILLNIVGNAFKYTEAGSIGVRLLGEPDAVVLVVQDSGVGISAGDLPHVFERFRRADDAALERSIEGTGLGLALVEQFVRMHNGTINIESTVGTGTTVTVRVPRLLQPASASSAPAFVPAPARAADHTKVPLSEMRLLTRDDASADPPNLGTARTDVEGRGTVLLAEDNPDMRNHLRRILEPEWTVRLARDGLEALELARADRPDLVITDVMMPRLDGLGLVRALRDDDLLCDVPVIMLSARAGQESSLEGIDAGATDYLVKPFSPVDLASRVRTNMRLSHARAQRLADAEDYSNRIAGLALLASRLAEAATSHDVAIAMFDLLPQLFGAVVGGLAVVRPGVEQFADVLQPDEVPDDIRERYANLPITENVPLLEAIREDREVEISDRAAFATRYPEAAPDAARLGIAALHALTLRSRSDQVIGALSLAWQTPHTFDASTRASLDTVVELCGATLERTQLYDLEHQLVTSIADYLVTPSSGLAAVDAAVRYRPALSTLGVGGDWYELFPLGDDRVGAVIGDVVGHGVKATAEMARLRTVIATLVRIGTDLDDLFRVAQSIVSFEDRSAFLGTALFAEIDAEAGTLRVSAAGHPAPLVWRPDGRVEPVAMGRHPALGITGNHSSPVAPVEQFEAGAVLVAFTDGLVERRHEDFDVSIERIRQLLAEIGDQPVERIADQLLATCRSDDAHDDVALIVVRSTKQIT